MMFRLPSCIRCIVIIIIFVLNQWNGFFINKSRVINFIFSVHFSFLVALNKHKNIDMGKLYFNNKMELFERRGHHYYKRLIPSKLPQDFSFALDPT